MQNQLTSFLKGVDKAACQWFGQYGGALDALGFALAVTPEPLSTKVGVGLMLANAAAEKGCDFDPATPEPPPPQGDYGIVGCCELNKPGAWITAYGPGTASFPIDTNSQTIKLFDIDYNASTTTLFWKELLPDGTETGGSINWDVTEKPLYIQYNAFSAGVECVGQCPKPDPITPEDIAPITYTDPDNGCEMNITFKGYAEGPAGSVYQITQVEPTVSLKANGGVISGCFFNPTIVVNKLGGGGGGHGGGGDEPPFTFPVPIPTPPPGDKWWEPYVRAALGGIVAGATEELLENLLNQAYPEMLYRAVSVCEKDESGEPISEAVEIPIPALKAPDAQIARLDAIVELLQAHKNFKQPICGNEKPELLGQWVTTRWISDEKMDHSGVRLRKLFRYRSQSTRDLGQLSAYWCGFTWKSGPVCVIHKGAWWGTPQVWAESAEEGKRVIRHAATEAGLDPDQVGGWTISSSRSPRNGMSGTMKILKKEGFPWVASRQGTDWPNYLASSSNP
jgi:hypothetical protein